MIRRPPRSTQSRSSAASDVYKRQRTALDTVFAADTFFLVNDRFEKRVEVPVLVVTSCGYSLHRGAAAGAAVADIREVPGVDPGVDQARLIGFLEDGNGFPGSDLPHHHSQRFLRRF